MFALMPTTSTSQRSIPVSDAHATLWELSSTQTDVMRPRYTYKAATPSARVLDGSTRSTQTSLSLARCVYVSCERALAVSLKRWQSQILTVPSSDPDTRNRLSRVTASVFTLSLCSCSVATSTPFGRHERGSFASIVAFSSLRNARRE